MKKKESIIVFINLQKTNDINNSMYISSVRFTKSLNVAKKILNKNIFFTSFLTII